MYLLIKPASGACNLRCRYCFYADEMSRRECGVRPIMTVGTARVIIKKALDRLLTLPMRERSLSLGFQGGEPMLAGIGFFRAVTDAVREYNVGVGARISYFIQTNGTMIDTEWAKFFAENRFLVGLSLDGVPETHDKNRIDASGGGTHSSVLRAASTLRSAGAEFNILTVLTGELARSAVKIYNYYQKQGFSYQQYIPCIAPLGGDDTPWTLTDERYGDFLCRVFDLWYADVAAGKAVYNREFENWIGILVGREPEDCGMRGICSEQYLIESDGSVYPCDFYAVDEWRLGDLVNGSFDDIDARRAELGFIESSRVIPDECRECRWLPLCRGGCRRNRDEAAMGKNRFCGAYMRFFEYAYPRMRRLADEVMRRRGRG